MDRRSSLKIDESCVGSKDNVYKQNGEPLERLNIIRNLLLAVVVAVQGVVTVGDNAEDLARAASSDDHADELIHWPITDLHTSIDGHVCQGSSQTRVYLTYYWPQTQRE